MFRGATLAVAFLTLVAGCSEAPPDSFSLSVEMRNDEDLYVVVANMTENNYNQCIIVLNSREGGFRLAEYVALPALDDAAFLVDEFRNAAGNSPFGIEDALVQCMRPNIVETIRVSSRG